MAIRSAEVAALKAEGKETMFGRGVATRRKNDKEPHGHCQRQ